MGDGAGGGGFVVGIRLKNKTKNEGWEWRVGGGLATAGGPPAAAGAAGGVKDDPGVSRPELGPRNPARQE